MGCGIMGVWEVLRFALPSAPGVKGARSTCPALGVPRLDWAASTPINHFFQGFSRNPNFDDPCFNSRCSFCVDITDAFLRGLVGTFCPL